MADQTRPQLSRTPDLAEYSTGEDVMTEDVQFEEDGFATVTQLLADGETRTQRVRVLNNAPHPQGNSNGPSH